LSSGAASEAAALIRSVEIDDRLALQVFEAYCALELDTGCDAGGRNTFATHQLPVGGTMVRKGGRQSRHVKFAARKHLSARPHHYWSARCRQSTVQTIMRRLHRAFR
jgi:hypothetical protein